MPRAKGIKPQFSFIRGLLTEASKLDYPEDYFEDGSNVEVELKGVTSRRLGLDYETNATLSTTSVAKGVVDSYAFNEFVWNNVGGDANRNFLVQQVGSTLHFYDLATSPVSAAKKSFTVDLTTYAAPGAVGVENTAVSFDSGQQRLFVSSAKIETIFVTYAADTDTISTSQVTIQIRDFVGVDDSLDVDERPSTLSAEHSYNLKNQGWIPTVSGGTDPVSTYFTANSLYPANNQQWWTGKDANDDFDTSLLDKAFFGNSPAPKGHFIIDAFNQDRSTVSGVAGITTVTEATRPVSVAFYAGRTWYLHKNNVYYSQTIQSDSNIGRCYQDADPTSEEISDIIDTDGGFIPIPEMGTGIKLFPMGSGIVVFGNNGTWFISGPDGSFTASNFFVNKIPGPGALNSASVVDVLGVPIWWSSNGIYTMQLDNVSQSPVSQNLSDTTIKTFFFDIPAVSRENAKGVYDDQAKRVTWLYSSSDGVPASKAYNYDRYLSLDTRVGAFLPGTIEESVDDYPMVVGLFTLPSINSVEEVNVVVDSSGNPVVDSSGNPIVAGTSTVSVSGSTLSTKFVILHDEDTSNVKWTFGEWNNSDFVDFGSIGGGQSFDSFVVTGPQSDDAIAQDKQTPYIRCFFERTETAFVDNGNNGYDFDKPSGCLFQARWEWSSSAASNRWSQEQQAYRFLQPYFVDPNDLTFDYGYDVITTKNKVRGKGKAYQLRFTSETGKDFRLLGWALAVEANQNM